MPYITAEQFRKLREVRDKLKMETCSFSLPNDIEKQRRYLNEDGEVLSGHVAISKAFTRDVVEGTRIWRRGWILNYLDEILGEENT